MLLRDNVHQTSLAESAARAGCRSALYARSLATDSPRDVWRTISRNDKVVLLCSCFIQMHYIWSLTYSCLYWPIGEYIYIQLNTYHQLIYCLILVRFSKDQWPGVSLISNQHRAFIQRASTSVTAKDITQNWSQNDNMKFTVLHVGVNDVRGGTSGDELVGNLKDSLVNMQMKFQNECVAFTEIFFVGAQNTQP